MPTEDREHPGENGIDHIFDNEPSHSGYVRGCRCEGCVDSRRIYNRQWMQEYRKKQKDV